MNAIHRLVQRVSGWAPARLIARGALLFGAVGVLAHIGEGALRRLDTTMSVTPVYAAASEQQGAASVDAGAADSAASATDSAAVAAAAGPPGAGSGSCADGAAPGCSGQAGPGLTADGRVILNTAGVAELTRLPGVGRRRAEAIVALRKRLGRFRRVRDLLRVRGIGFKSLRKITPLVVVDPPADAKAGSK